MARQGKVSSGSGRDAAIGVEAVNGIVLSIKGQWL